MANWGRSTEHTVEWNFSMWPRVYLPLWSAKCLRHHTQHTVTRRGKKAERMSPTRLERPYCTLYCAFYREVRYMIVVMGGGGVGKSCLTFRLVHKEFLEVYDPTVEDFYRKANFMVDDEICPIEIMDTAGQVGHVETFSLQQWTNVTKSQWLVSHTASWRCPTSSPVNSPLKRLSWAPNHLVTIRLMILAFGTAFFFFQDEFAAMRDLYYKKGHGFLFVFSLIDSSSVNDVKERFDSLLAARVMLHAYT